MGGGKEGVWWGGLGMWNVYLLNENSNYSVLIPDLPMF